MRVLVTGAAGFLGQHLVERLLQNGCTVRCLIRRESDQQKITDAAGAGVENRLEYEIGSVTDAELCRKIVNGVDVIFHLAAAMGGSPASMVVNNVVGTRILLEAVVAAKISRIVLVSSIAVYDTSKLDKHGILDEDCPLDSAPELRDAYCYSKVKQEAVAWDICENHGIPLVVVRPGVLFGPGRSILSTRVGLRDGRLLFRVGGNHPLPYSYVSNCADAVCRAGYANRIEGHALNIVDSELPTGKQLVRLYKKRVGWLCILPIPIMLLGLVTGFSHWYHRWSKGQLPDVFDKANSYALWKPVRYSNANAREKLGWEPAVGMEAGLRKVFGD